MTIRLARSPDLSPTMPPSPPIAKSKPPRSMLGRLGVGLASVGVALAATLAWQWWQDRPLRAAEDELARGNAPRALALAEYYLDLHPASGRAESARARALVGLGKGKEAGEIYERVGAATADDLVAWARSYMLREQWSRAGAILEQVLRLRPDDADALYEIATCHTRLGRLTEATEAADRYAALPGCRARGDVLLGAIRADASDPEAAALAYERALVVEPDLEGLQVPPEEFLEQYATVLMNIGRDDDARRLLERGIAVRPTATSHHLLGKVLLRNGNQEEARRHWITSIELDPSAVSPREELVSEALARGDLAGAKEWIGPLERLADRRFPSAYLFQRLAAFEKDDAAFASWKARTDALRDKEDRIKSLEQMMASGPRSYWGTAVRAHKFATLGNWRQARDLFEGLQPRDDEDPFITELREAIRNQSPLPSLDRVPLDQK